MDQQVSLAQMPLCPEAVARAIGDSLDVMVAPTFSIGMAQHHLGFPGSITLRPSTLISVILDTVNSLSRHGFSEFYFLNGHGGNIASVSAAFSEVYTQSSLAMAPDGQAPLRCKLRNWWDGPKVQKLSTQLFGASEGSHATCSEISVTLPSLSQTH